MVYPWTNPVLYKEITKERLAKHENIHHDVSQYIDKSVDSIGQNSIPELLRYTEEYIRLLKIYNKAKKTETQRYKEDIHDCGNKM